MLGFIQWEGLDIDKRIGKLTVDELEIGHLFILIWCPVLLDLLVGSDVYLLSAFFFFHLGWFGMRIN